jgi:hypothetical protein
MLCVTYSALAADILSDAVPSTSHGAQDLLASEAECDE